MKQQGKHSTLAAAGALVIGLLAFAGSASAVTYDIQDGNIISIGALPLKFDDSSPIADGLYDISFVTDTGVNQYGPADSPTFDFVLGEDGLTALVQITQALNTAPQTVTGASATGSDTFFIPLVRIPIIGIGTVWGAAGAEFISGVWGDCKNDCVAGSRPLNPNNVETYARVSPASGEPPPPTGVDLTGDVQDEGGTGLCAMVLASGQFVFSCNPNGPYSLLDLPTESDGTVTRQVYANGFFPDVENLPGSTDETVVMTRANNCPDYNSFAEPGVFPGSAGNRIDISGTVLQQNTQTPVCAIVLANGQFMFSCDSTGSYNLNIPLDNNGQYNLQVYAAGFAPLVQRFDEFSPDLEVRLARATECQ